MPVATPAHLSRSLFLIAGGLLALSACSTPAAKNWADREVYRLLDKVRGREQIGDGHFTIDTRYSGETPSELEPAEILKDRANGISKKIAINDALSLAIGNSREFQARRERLYLSALTYTGVKHQFRPHLFAGSRGSKTWLPLGTRGTGDGTSDTFAELDTDAGATQALTTGASLAVDFVNDILRYYTGDPRRKAVSTINLGLVQPLLRGTGHRIAGEKLTQSFRNVVYEARDYSHYQAEFSRDVVVSYFRLLQSRDGVSNAYSDYQSRLKTTEYLLARAVDRENPLMARKAEQAELSAKNRYVDAVIRFRDSLDAYKLRLGIPIPTDLRLDGGELKRLRSTGLVPLTITRQDALVLAMDHRLPLVNEIDRFEDARRQIVVAADALEPGLTFVGNAAFLSDKPLNFADFSFSNLEADVALQLDLPVNRKLERNALRTSLIRFEEEIRSLGLTMDTLRRDIDRGIRRLEQFSLNYKIQQEAVEQARLRVEGTQLKLEAGTAILRDLEEAQDSLLLAQNAVTAALVDHLEARLNLLVDLGILDWEKPAFWLSANASKIKIPQAKDRKTAGDSILRNGEVIPPNELFPDS